MQTSPERPLFIPVVTSYYNAFACGQKDYEVRLYGARWNENTCRVGREVVVSKGYGNSHRLHGVVSRFEKIHCRSLTPESRRHLLGTEEIVDVWFAVVFVKLGLSPS